MKIRFLRFVLLMGAVLAAIASASAQSTIFVSRHADRGAEEPDPPLTEIGFCQAEALSLLLADANIKHIYTSDMIRTQQTAAPTARRSTVTPVIVNQKDFDGLIERVRATLRDGESTLVVGHRSTVPRIVKALSGQDIAPLGSGEYTRLVAVTLWPDGRSSVVTLHQGGDCGAKTRPSQ